MDQSRDLSLSHLAGTETKDEQQRVDNVGLAGTVGTDDRRERSMEGADFLSTGVTLEVDEHQVSNDDAWLRTCILDNGKSHGP